MEKKEETRKKESVASTHNMTFCSYVSMNILVSNISATYSLEPICNVVKTTCWPVLVHYGSEMFGGGQGITGVVDLG